MNYSEWLLLVVIVSCGTTNTTIQHPKPVSQQYSDEIAPYVWRFEQLLGRPVKSRIVIVADIGKDDPTARPDVIGFCEMENNYIEISKSYWESVTLDAREALLFHELGHCELFRQHLNTYNISIRPPLDGRICPTSLMFWAFPPECYGTNRTYYLNELFGLEE